MRYRTLKNGDMTFGSGGANFLVNNPDAVAQAVLTRLKLVEGEWFLDTTEGTPYKTQILGYGTKGHYDPAIRDRILGTEGVRSILSYSSSVINRRLTVNATIDTIYGATPLSAVL